MCKKGVNHHQTPLPHGDGRGYLNNISMTMVKLWTPQAWVMDMLNHVCNIYAIVVTH